MWAAKGYDLKMTEGDWGIQLPFTIHDVTFSNGDEIKITVKTKLNGETKIAKTYSDISENKVMFALTEAESELLPVGTYVYSIDWYHEGAFLCNIIPSASLKVVDKA